MTEELTTNDLYGILQEELINQGIDSRLARCAVIVPYERFREDNRTEIKELWKQIKTKLCYYVMSTKLLKNNNVIYYLIGDEPGHILYKGDEQK